MNPTMRGYTIRKETESDRRTVEHITREAFWNVYAPGCSEHYKEWRPSQEEFFIYSHSSIVR